MGSNTSDLITKFRENIEALPLSDGIRSKLNNNFTIIENEALRYDAACQNGNTLAQEKYKYAHDALINANVMLDTIMLVAQNPGSLHLIEHVFKGGHVIVNNDGGAIKKLLEDSRLGNHRFSSHHNLYKKCGNMDIGMQAYKIFNEGLFGNSTAHGDGTWFQMEGTSTTGRTLFEAIYNTLVHLLVDFVTYVVTGKNVGQYGNSEHTDRNPIVVSL